MTQYLELHLDKLVQARWQLKEWICGQSYKALYDRNIRPYSCTDNKIAHITTLGSKFTLVKRS